MRQPPTFDVRDDFALDELRTMTAGLRRLAKNDPVDRAKLHDAIAGRVVEADGYTC